MTSVFGHGPRGTLLRVALSLALAGAILLADVLSGAKGMAGVLYVPLLVAIATEARTREVLWFGLLGMALAVVAHVFVRHYTPGLITAWPLGVGLASVLVASALLARLVRSREALVDANRELAHSEWRYRSIFEQTRFPFWERDFSGAYAIYDRLRAEGVTDLRDYGRRNPGFAETLARSVRTLNANDAMLRLVGARTRAEFPATLADMMPEPESMLTLQQALFDGVTRMDGRSTLTALSGEVRDVWVSAELSPDPHRVGVMIGMLVDLTESERSRRVLQAAQAELARASRVSTVGALSASIAHELNQPLAAAVMNAQTGLRYLRRAVPDLPAAIAAVARAADDGNRAAEIVRRTRDAVANRARQDEPVDIGALCRGMVALLDAEIAAAAVRVHFQLPEAPLVLRADRVALQQALANLLGNAVQSMRAGPPEARDLTLALRQEAGDAVLEIRDTGAGIADEHAGSLFQPFFTTKPDGIGVGLAIAQAAVEARGGTLSARNGPAGGAVFECRLPLVTGER